MKEIRIDIFPKKTYRLSTCMYMKRYSTSLRIRETQIKPQQVIRSHLLECLFGKTTNSKQWWEHGEKRTLGLCYVYVSDYEYMDVSITDLIWHHIQVNVWAVLMSEQVWEHVCASQCGLVHVYNHMFENEHGSLFKYEFVCWSKWNFSYGWVNVWPWAWILAYSCMWDECLFLIMWKWSIYLRVNVQVCAYEYTWIPLRVKMWEHHSKCEHIHLWEYKYDAVCIFYMGNCIWLGSYLNVSECVS